jgi:hypothetical protein
MIQQGQNKNSHLGILAQTRTGGDNDRVPESYVKERLIETDLDIKAEFDQARSELKFEAEQNSKDFNETASNQTMKMHKAYLRMEADVRYHEKKYGNKTRHMIKNSTKQIMEELRIVEDAADETIEANIRMRMIWLEIKIEEKTEELTEV